MKKVILAMIFIILFGVVTAGLLANNDRDITLSREQKTALANIGITNYSTSDYEVSDDYVRRCLEGNGINKCITIQTYYENCSAEFDPDIDFECEMVRTDYTSQEIADLLDTKEEELMKKIADNQIRRSNAVSPTQTGEGVTTIK